MNTAVTLWAATVLVTLAAGLSYWRSGRVAGVAFCFFMLFPLLRPLLFFFNLSAPIPENFFSDDPWPLISAAIFLNLLWLIFFSVAYLLLERPARKVGTLIFPQFGGDQLKYRRLVIAAAVVSSIIAVAATLLLVAQYGSIARFTFAVKVGKELQGGYVVRQMSSIAILIATFGMFFLAVDKPSSVSIPGNRKIPLEILFLMSCLILANLATNFLWGNRYNIAVTGACILVGYHFYIRRLKLSEIVFFIVLALVVLQALKYVRLGLVDEALDRQAINRGDFWHDVSTSLHLVEFDAFMLSIRDVGDRFEFRNGQDFANGLLSWIPSFLLPDKETFQIGGWFRRVYDPTKVNGWPIGVVGAWYINFGPLGIIIGALLSGFASAAVDRTYWDLRHNAWAASVGPGLAFFLTGAGLNTGALQQYVLFVIPLGIFVFLLRAVSLRGRSRVTSW